MREIEVSPRGGEPRGGSSGSGRNQDEAHTMSRASNSDAPAAAAQASSAALGSSGLQIPLAELQAAAGASAAEIRAKPPAVGAPVVTVFADRHGKRITASRAMDMREVERVIRTARAAVDKASLPLLKLATFGDVKSDTGALRHDGNVVLVSGIEGDYDGERVPMQAGAEALRALGLAALLYTSASHTPDAPRWRVLVPLATPLEGTPDQIRHQRSHWCGVLNAILGGVLSRESFTLSQSYFFGAIQGNAAPDIMRLEGRCLDQLEEPPKPLLPAAGIRVERTEQRRDPTTDTELRAAFVRGQGRHDAMLKLAARWAARGMARDDIAATLSGLFEQDGAASPFNHEGVDLRTEVPRIAAGAVAKFGETRADPPPPEHTAPLPVDAYEEPSAAQAAKPNGHARPGNDVRQRRRSEGSGKSGDGASAQNPLHTVKASDGEAILNDVESFVGRFVAYPSEHARVAHVLWIAHTHLMDCWDSTPRIAFLSPEPGSGKSRALEVSELLVPNPVQSINASAAYLFRKISDPEGLPTILFDEVDTLFGPKAKEHEEVRGVLNAGHRRGAVAGRCVIVGKGVQTEELPAYCAVALAGLGNLPDTILTRSVIVRMQRRAPGEKVEPFRHRLARAEGYPLRDRMAAWALLVAHKLTGTYPVMPEEITDRPADVWEALLSVADAAGGQWTQRARTAALALVKAAQDSTPSLRIRLLADLRTIFGDAPALYSQTIIDQLTGGTGLDDDAPWGDLKGKPLDKGGLASMLRHYEVKPTKVRERGNKPLQGYTRQALHDVWQRYLPASSPEKPEHPEQPPVNPDNVSTNQGFGGVPGSALQGGTVPEQEPEHVGTQARGHAVRSARSGCSGEPAMADNPGFSAAGYLDVPSVPAVPGFPGEGEVEA